MVEETGYITNLFSAQRYVILQLGGFYEKCLKSGKIMPSHVSSGGETASSFLLAVTSLR